MQLVHQHSFYDHEFNIDSCFAVAEAKWKIAYEGKKKKSKKEDGKSGLKWLFRWKNLELY